MDTRQARLYTDGSVEYLDGPQPDENVPLKSFPWGFMAGCGVSSIPRAAFAAMAGRQPADLAETVEIIRPRLREAIAEVIDLGVDPETAHNVKVFVLTYASGDLEFGHFHGETFDDHGSGHNTYAPPFGTDRADSIERFRRFEAETPHATSNGYDVCRALGRLSLDMRRRTGTVSGRAHLALIQRPPGHNWSSAVLIADARDFADATDSEISAMWRPA